MGMREERSEERRRSRRFRLRAGVDLATASVHGKVLEVSRSGLAFAYQRNGGNSGPRAPEGAILFGNGILFLSACVIIPVWEEVAREAVGRFWRCGVRFHKLSPGQLRDLGQLIRIEAAL